MLEGRGRGAGRASSREAELERKIAALEAKLPKKDQVIAEISQEYVDLADFTRLDHPCRAHVITAFAST